MNNRKVVVTGSNGFIGQHLVKRLIANGCRVVGVDQTHDNSPEMSLFRTINHDLTSDLKTISSLIADADFVFHIAAVTRTRTSSDLSRINIAMTRNVLSAFRENHSLSKFIFVSSVAACGPMKNGVPLTEDLPCNPVSHYGRSKAACEKLLSQYSDTIPISIVRPPIVLGPGDFIGLKMFQTIQKWKLHFVTGDRKRSVGFVSAADLVNALILVGESGERMEATQGNTGIYFVATRDSIRFDELGRTIGALLKTSNLKIVPVPMKFLKLFGYANDLINRFSARLAFFNSDKIKDSIAGSWSVDSGKIQKLGFKPTKEIEKSLGETIKWYQERHLLK